MSEDLGEATGTGFVLSPPAPTLLIPKGDIYCLMSAASVVCLLPHLWVRTLIPCKVTGL